MTYEWTISTMVKTVHEGDIGVKLAESVAVRASADGGVESISINSTELEAFYLNGWTDLSIVVVVTNSLLQSDTSDPLIIALSSDSLPSAEIIGGNFMSTKSGNELAIHALAVATACDGRSLSERRVLIDWILAKSDESDGLNTRRRFLREGSVASATPRERRVLLTSTSSDPRTFKLPAFSLNPATVYMLTVFAVDMTTGASNSAYTIVSVIKGDIFAIVDGGDRAVSTAAANITVSAESSYDEDKPGLSGAAAGLLFSWTCVNSATDEVCSIVNSNDEALSFQGNELKPGSYRITVIVSDVNGTRSATNSVTLIAEEAERPDVFLVKSALTTVSSNQRTVIRAVITAPSAVISGNSYLLNSSWSLTTGDLVDGNTLESATTTMLEVSREREPRASYSHDLALRSSVLSPGSTYSFRLTSVIANSYGFSEGFASVTIIVSRSPTGGRIEVNPPSGVALIDRFTLTALNWVADEPPLKYAFSTVNEANQKSILRKPTLDNVLDLVTLEAGNLTIWVYVSDASDAEGSASTVAQVAQTDLKVRNDSENLGKLTDRLIEEAKALNSYESVCQVVVASARQLTADTNKSRILSLVAALREAEAFKDKDSNSISQSASALQAPVSVVANAGLIDDNLGISVLNLALVYAQDAREFGLGESSTETVTAILDVVSNVLGSTLFEGDNALNIDADQLLMNTLDATSFALLDEMISDEAASGSCSHSICQAVRRISEADNKIVTIEDMRAAVEIFELIGETTLEFETYLYDFAQDPRGGGSSLVGNVLRFHLVVVSDLTEVTVGARRSLRNQGMRLPARRRLRRRLEDVPSASAQMRLLVPKKMNATDLGVVEDSVTIVDLDCPWDYIGNATATCPATTNYEGEPPAVTRRCDGTRTTYKVHCGLEISAACAGRSNDDWDHETGKCSLVSETDDSWICECRTNDQETMSDYGTVAATTAFAALQLPSRRFDSPSSSPTSSNVQTPNIDSTMLPTPSPIAVYTAGPSVFPGMLSSKCHSF